MMTGQPFLGYPVKRQCGVLLLAAEGVIRDTTHPIYRELFGMPKEAGDTDGGDI